MRFVKLSLAVLAATFAAQSALAAPPPILSGQWNGKATCTGLNGGAKTKFKFQATISFSHSATLNLLAAAVELANGEASISLVGCGFAIGENDKPGRVRAAIGDGDPGLGTFFTGDLAKIEVMPANSSGVSGRLKGTLLIGNKSQEDLLGCKIKVDRISEDDPGIIIFCSAPPV